MKLRHRPRGPRRAPVAGLLLIVLALAAPGRALTLREAFDAAGPGGSYDKLVELETGVVYTGGLLIGPVLSGISYLLEGDAGLDVRIQGNGAILDLEGQQLCISYCNNRLDIEDCVILNGDLRFRGKNDPVAPVHPVGTVRYVTFYGCHDYGVRILGAGTGITFERNLVVDAVSTGNDFVFTTGIAHEWLPTGANICFSVQDGFYGWPTLSRNWSYHSDPELNVDTRNHFLRL